MSSLLKIPATLSLLAVSLTILPMTLLAKDKETVEITSPLSPEGGDLTLEPR